MYSFKVKWADPSCDGMFLDLGHLSHIDAREHFAGACLGSRTAPT